MAMARKGIGARRHQFDDVSPFVIWRRVGWVALAGLWVFGVVALASFDSADWPSHMVAVHNLPTRNLCGPVGALIAYWSYYLIGVGSWIALAGLGGYLVLAVAGPTNQTAALGLRHRDGRTLLHAHGRAIRREHIRHSGMGRALAGHHPRPHAAV